MKPDGADEGTRPPVRRAIAVMVSRFPLVTETFILREIAELERQGQPVLLVPLLKEVPPLVHREAAPWMQRALFTPFVSPAILVANLRACRRNPLRYGALLARLLWGTAASPNFLVRTLALFPKSVYLAERLCEEGVGHIHAHFATHPATAAMIVSQLTDIPFSFTAHAHDIFVRRALLRVKIRRARFVRSISRFNRDFLLGRCADVAKQKIHVIHVGIDMASYAAQPLESPAQMSDPPNLLCVAALKPYKGLPVLIEACRQLRAQGIALRCDIVGDGPLRPQIEKAITQAGLGGVVRILGACTQDQVTRLVAGAALFVLPSTVAPDGQMEGIPVSLMEAMASSRAVVASALSGIPELVEDGVSGILVAPGNAAELAAALRRLLSDPQGASRMGKSGREAVSREFQLQPCVSALLERIDLDNAPPSPDILRRVADSTWPGFAGRAIGIRRTREGRDSSVAELVVSGGREAEELILKAHKPSLGDPRPAREIARMEFEVLARLHRCFSSGGQGAGEAVVDPDGSFGVPRPVYVDEPAAGVVMERCRGKPLDHLTREARLSVDPRSWESLCSAVLLSGRWLRRFQRYTAQQGDARAALEALLAGAMEDLEICARRHVRWPLGFSSRIRQLAPQVGPSFLRLVGQHGDFWPGNLYVERDAVEVIDFEGFRMGLPYEDAAYFLLELELFFSYPLLRRRRLQTSSAFLEGYLGGEALDRAGYALCRMAKALRILRLSLEGPGGSDLGPWQRRALRALLLEAS